MPEDAGLNMNDVLNAIADPVLIIDRDYKIVFVNKAALELCDVSPDEVVGKNCHEISHNCPVPCAPPEICPHREVFATGKPLHVTHKHCCTEEKKKIFGITASPIRDADGHVVQMIEVLRDITEQEKTAESLKATLLELEKSDRALQKSEAFMQNILQSIDEGFIVIAPDYRIISANKAYCRQVKCKTDKILGKHCYEVSHHRDKPCYLAGEECAPARTYRTGAPSLAIHTHYDSEKNPVYIETRSYPIKDESGAVIAVIETLNNITEVRKLEEQLRHAQKMEAIGTLAGGIAHDFNNILTAIIGYGNLMQIRMREDDPSFPQLKQMLAAGDRAARLTSGLLAFSRKQVMNLKTVNVNGIIMDLRKMLERIIGEDIEFKVSAASEDLIVNADAGQIEQVLMNLASNARDAMPQGGNLTIETGRTPMDNRFIATHGFGEPGGYAMITVKDTGTGMDEAIRQRIFEPYFTTKELGRGTGLGLSIAFGIVKQHKGFMECLSEVEKGAKFNIYIPLTEQVVEKGVVEPSESLPTGAETVLIAEDDATVRTLTKEMLADYGYMVIEAVDGEDAVRKFKDNQDRIKLLLFDVILPKKSGRAAYEEIKRMSPEIKTIFFSGYARELIQDRGVFEQGTEFLQKPVSLKDLLKKIRAILDRNRT